MRLAALDVEATCLDPSKCRVVALALVPFDPTRKELNLSNIIYAVNTGIRADGSALIHGITGESQHVKPTHDFRTALILASRYTLVTYGSHDARFLAYEAQRHGLKLRYCYIDILSSLLALDRYRVFAEKRGRFTLEDALREVLGISLEERKLHDPISDAVHAAMLYVHLTSRGLKTRTHCTSPGSRGFSRIFSIIVKLLGGY